MLFFQGSTPAEKSETEDAGTGAESDEREKASDADVLSPATVQSPDAETNLDFVKYTCDTRKTAMKDGNIITISSVTQARVRIDGFTSGRDMLGKMLSDRLLLISTCISNTRDPVSPHSKHKKSEKNMICRGVSLMYFKVFGNEVKPCLESFTYPLYQLKLRRKRRNKM